MENWITLSVDETELDFDSGGAVTLIPLLYIKIIRQISPERFYIKDTSDNEGEFHYRQTNYPSPSSLVGFFANYTQIVAFESGYIISELIDLESTGTTTIPVPTGYIFFCDEVGVIAEDADTVTVFPNIEWGVDGDTDYYALAQDAYSLIAANDRYRQTTMLQSKGETVSLKAVINTGATATALTGRFYFKGFYLRNTAALP